jgi:hypothetical protein
MSVVMRVGEDADWPSTSRQGNRIRISRWHQERVPGIIARNDTAPTGRRPGPRSHRTGRLTWPYGSEGHNGPPRPAVPPIAGPACGSSGPTARSSGSTMQFRGCAVTPPPPLRSTQLRSGLPLHGSVSAARGESQHGFSPEASSVCGPVRSINRSAARHLTPPLRLGNGAIGSRCTSSFTRIRIQTLI